MDTGVYVCVGVSANRNSMGVFVAHSLLPEVDAAALAYLLDAEQSSTLHRTTGSQDTTDRTHGGAGRAHTPWLAAV